MKKLSLKEWIGVVVAVVFVAYMLFGGTIINIFRNSSLNVAANTAALDNSINQMDNKVNAQDIVVGNGKEIGRGDLVSVNYVLRLQNGTVVQDSKQVSQGQPFKFIYGAGQVIPGWEIGMAGMKVGGKRVIVVPPQLAYGEKGYGPISPNSTLIFEIEVVKTEVPPQQPVQ